MNLDLYLDNISYVCNFLIIVITITKIVLAFLSKKYPKLRQYQSLLESIESFLEWIGLMIRSIQVIQGRSSAI
jgi:hypothetical protein